MNQSPALRALARRLGNPIGRPASPREIFELVRRYRGLSPGARGVVLRLVAGAEQGRRHVSEAPRQ